MLDAIPSLLALFRNSCPHRQLGSGEMILQLLSHSASCEHHFNKALGEIPADRGGEVKATVPTPRPPVLVSWGMVGADVSIHLETQQNVQQEHLSLKIPPKRFGILWFYNTVSAVYWGWGG